MVKVPPPERCRGDAELERSECSDPLDLRSVVQEHHAAVYRYAFRLAGNQADAEDLTQQTFLVAQQRLDQVRDLEKIQSWLFAVLRSCYLKSFRRQRPTQAGSLELDMDTVPGPVESDAIDREALQLALEELPPEFRIVVVMFYFEDFSYKEIAAQLEVPIGTVMSRLARAKMYLRRQLAAQTDASAEEHDSVKETSVGTLRP
jgi:RNA polymerase sigma-70 factor (ECF subfamily)